MLGRSEPLGADEGVGEVDEEPGGHEGAESKVEGHGGLPSEPFAEDGVAGGEREDGEASGEEEDVGHGSSVSVGPAGGGHARDRPRPTRNVDGNRVRVREGKECDLIRSA